MVSDAAKEAFSLFKFGKHAGLLKEATEVVAEKAKSSLTVDALNTAVRADKPVMNGLRTAYKDFIESSAKMGIKEADARQAFISGVVGELPTKLRGSPAEYKSTYKNVTQWVSEPAEAATPSLQAAAQPAKRADRVEPTIINTTKPETTPTAKTAAAEAAKPIQPILQGDDPVSFAAQLLNKKHKTVVEPGTFGRLEAALKKDNLLVSEKLAADGAGPRKNITDIVTSIRNKEPITVDEFARLKEQGGKWREGFSSTPNQIQQAPITQLGANLTNVINPAFWVSKAKGAFHTLINPLDTVEAYKWGGKESPGFWARALGTTALATGVFVGIPNGYSSYVNADLSTMSVERDKGWGIILNFVDEHNLLGGADLENVTGDSKTHYISDQEYDKLTKGGSINEAFVSRTKTITGMDLSTNTAADKSSPEYLAGLYNVASKAQRNQTAFNPQIMVAYNAALSRNIGMIGTDEHSKTTTDINKIVDFARTRYINSVAERMVSPDGTALLNEKLGKFYGRTNLNDVDLVREFATHKKANDGSEAELDRLMIGKFLIRKNLIDENELNNFDALQKKAQTITESSLTAQATQNALDNANGVQPQRTPEDAEKELKEKVRISFKNAANTFPELKDKESELNTAFNKARENGRFDKDKFDTLLQPNVKDQELRAILKNQVLELEMR